MERAYRQSTRLLGVLLMVLGLALVVSTLARGGGIFAVGVLLGIGMATFGGARVYLAAHTPESSGGS